VTVRTIELVVLTLSAQSPPSGRYSLAFYMAASRTTMQISKEQTSAKVASASPLPSP
jgi:hypothetical protein